MTTQTPSGPAPVLLMVRHPDIGGSERQMSVVACSLDRKRFTPHVGCFRSGGLRRRELEEAGVPIVEFPVHSFKSPKLIGAAMQLRSYVRRHGIRLVHGFDVPACLFAIPALTLMPSTIPVSSQRAHRELISRGERRLLRLTDKLARAIVANSEQMRRHVIDDEGVPPERVHLCYNGIDLDVFKRGTERRPELRDAELVVGVVCALRPEKDLATLLRAFVKVRDLRPRVRLAIVGDGASKREWQRLAAELGLNPDAVFFPATRSVVPWVQSIDIFVLPSTSEALSNSLMEAMACGCAAVASRVGGNPELVHNESTGLLFEARDADGLAACLERLILQPELRAKLSLAGQKFLRDNFSIAASVARMAEIYEGLLSGA